MPILSFSEIFENEIPYDEIPDILTFSEIFENEIPYDEETTNFENTIFKYSFDNLSFNEFRNYLEQFYKYISKKSYYYKHDNYYKEDVKKIYFIYLSFESFSDFYYQIEDAYADFSISN